MTNPRKITAAEVLADKPPRVPNTSIRMPPSMKEALVQIAERENRNLSAQCLHMLKHAVAQELNR